MVCGVVEESAEAIEATFYGQMLLAHPVHCGNKRTDGELVCADSTELGRRDDSS